MHASFPGLAWPLLMSFPAKNLVLWTHIIFSSRASMVPYGACISDQLPVCAQSSFSQLILSLWRCSKLANSEFEDQLEQVEYHSSYRLYGCMHVMSFLIQQVGIILLTNYCTDEYRLMQRYPQACNKLPCLEECGTILRGFNTCKSSHEIE
jgi:hypothetical protein